MRPRPNSLLGLSLALLRLGATRYPGRSLAIALVLLVAVVAVARRCSSDRDLSRATSTSTATSRSPCHLVGSTWRAGVTKYDHLQTIDFGEADRGGRGRGAMVYGYGQAVRLDLTFRYRRLGDGALRLHGWSDRQDDRPWPGRPRRVRFALKRGNYRFERDTPGGKERLRFRCRLRFSKSPFPGGEPGDTDYYAVPLPP